jgi:hypothetical protein
MSTPAPRQGISLRADPTASVREWCRSYIRAGTAITLAKIQKDLPEKILSDHWSDDHRAALIVRNFNNAITTRAAVTPAMRADYPGATIVQLISLAPGFVAEQLFPRAIMVDLKGVDTFRFPLPASFANAVFIAEGAAIPMRMSLLVGPVCKLALITSMTNELKNAAPEIAETVLRYAIRTAVGYGLDSVLLSNTAAVAGVSPAGLLNGVGPISGTSSAAGDISKLVTAIATAGIATASVVFIAATPQAMSLKMQPWPKFDYTVIEAPRLAAGVVIAVASDALVIAGGDEPRFSTEAQADAHMAEPASQLVSAGGTVAAPHVSAFQSDLQFLRCIANITWSVVPGAVQYLTGATW